MSRRFDRRPQCGLGLAFGVLFSVAATAIPIHTFTKIADRESPIPDGSGAFVSFGGTFNGQHDFGALNNGQVAFLGQGQAIAPGQQQSGLYKWDGSNLSSIKTTLPGTAPGSTSFGPPALANGNASFLGFNGFIGNQDNLGLYRSSGPDDIEILWDRSTTPVPGTLPGFRGFSSFALDPASETYALLAPNQSLHHFDGTQFRLVANAETPVPVVGGTFGASIKFFGVDNESVAFTGIGGIYLDPGDGGGLRRVAGGNSFETLGLPSLDGGQVAFSAKQGLVSGVYIGDGLAAPTRLLDTTTVVSVDGVSGRFDEVLIFDMEVALDEGLIAFGGRFAGGERSLFSTTTTNPTKISKIAAPGDTVDGRIVQGVSFASEGFDAGSAVVSLDFGSADRGLFRADPIDLKSTPAFTLYGIEQVGSTPHLITLSPENAARDDLGVIAGLGNLEGLVFGGQNNKLYSVENRSDAAASTLVEIDPLTKFIREVGTIGLDDSNTSPSSLGRSVSDLTFGPDGTLYATTRGAGSSGRLITVDLESGTGALVGRLPNQPRGLAYDPTTDKFLTYAGSLDLFEVDPTVIVPGTGGFLQTTDIGGSAGFSRLAATGDPDTPLFTVGTNPNRLYSRNLNATTLVGSLDTSNQIRGLAAEPLSFNEPPVAPDLPFVIGDTTLRPLTTVPFTKLPPGEPCVFGLCSLSGDFNPNLPTVVVTHGWQPGEDRNNIGKGNGFVDPQQLLEGAVSERLAGEANVLEYTWPEAFTATVLNGLLPNTITNGLKETSVQTVPFLQFRGVDLAHALNEVLTEAGPYDEPIQLIGHSFGGAVNAYAASRLSKLGKPVDQLTLLDLPLLHPDLNLGTIYGALPVGTVDYVDSFFGLLPTAGFGGPISGAAPESLLENGGNLVFGAHADGLLPFIRGVDRIYVEDFILSSESEKWITAALDTNFGSRPQPVGWNPPTRTERILLSPFVSLEDHLAGTVLGVARPVFEFAFDTVPGTLMATSDLVIPFLGDANLKVAEFSIDVAEGAATFVIDVGGDLVEISGFLKRTLGGWFESSPAVWSLDVTIPVDMSTLIFSFLVPEVGDGDWFTVHFDDKLLWTLTLEPFLDVASFSDAIISIEDIQGQTGTLYFTLHSVGAANASLVAGDLRFSSFQSGAAVVPEPSTLALILSGVFSLLYGKSCPRWRLAQQDN